MICVIALCVLLTGGGPRECSPDSMEAFYLEEPRTRAECKETFGMLKHVLPANLRLVSFDWFKPQVQTAQEPRR